MAQISWEEVHTRALDGAGTICRVYGINPLYGRLLATLFLSVEPLSLAELSDRTQAAKSTVSVAIRRLAAFRMVQRRDVAGDRRDFYVVNLDAKDIINEFIQSYLRRELEIGSALLAHLRQDLRQVKGKGAPTPAERKVLQARVESMAKATDALSKWVERLSNAGRIKRGLLEFLGLSSAAA